MKNKPLEMSKEILVLFLHIAVTASVRYSQERYKSEEQARIQLAILWEEEVSTEFLEKHDLVTSCLETYYYLPHSYGKEMSVDISLQHNNFWNSKPKEVGKGISGLWNAPQCYTCCSCWNLQIEGPCCLDTFKIFLCLKVTGNLSIFNSVGQSTYF